MPTNIVANGPSATPPPFPAPVSLNPVVEPPKVRPASYSGCPVHELQCNNVPVMRRVSDHWINATHILRAAGLPKPQRTKVLERDVTSGVHEKVQGGYAGFQGTWIPLEDARLLAGQYGIRNELEPLFNYVAPKDEVRPRKREPKKDGVKKETVKKEGAAKKEKEGKVENQKKQGSKKGKKAKKGDGTAILDGQETGGTGEAVHPEGGRDSRVGANVKVEKLPEETPEIEESDNQVEKQAEVEEDFETETELGIEDEIDGRFERNEMSAGISAGMDAEMMEGDGDDEKERAGEVPAKWSSSTSGSSGDEEDIERPRSETIVNIRMSLRPPGSRIRRKPVYPGEDEEQPLRKRRAVSKSSSSQRWSAEPPKGFTAVDDTTSTSAFATGGVPPQPGHRCEGCGATSTPQWRRGPSGKRTLCNACGVKWTFGRLKRPAPESDASGSEDEIDVGGTNWHPSRAISSPRRTDPAPSSTTSPRSRASSSTQAQALHREIEQLRRKLRESEKSRKRMRDMLETANQEDSEVDRKYRRAVAKCRLHRVPSFDAGNANGSDESMGERTSESEADDDQELEEVTAIQSFLRAVARTKQQMDFNLSRMQLGHGGVAPMVQ
ncbi:hypothetical protein HK104_006835 [Borealophlyctis nickersoniae]|nr:hypothetical protein HK104_006835 [Borealophlyctis nickersoniae]